MEDLFRDFGKALVRTPLYSWHDLFAEDGSTHDLESLVYKRLNDPVFLEAIYWSSPQLYERVQKLKTGKLDSEKEQNLLHTLSKYLIRSHTRATPYGIFAGTGIVNIGETVRSFTTKLERIVKVDSELLQNILHRIETDTEIFPHLRYSLNDTLYRIPGQFRFTEKIIKQGKTTYQLSSLEVTSLLEKIHGLMANQKWSARESFEILDVDAPFRTFNIFLDELIKSQFLVSELRQGPTVKNELSGYLEILNRIETEGNRKAGKYRELLTELQTAADNFSKLPLGVLPLIEIKGIKEKLKECKIDCGQDHLFHANLKKAPAAGCALSSEQVSQVKKGILVLRKLSDSKEKVEDHLSSFKTLFEKKYGSREIPLSEALDPEYGIAFPPVESIGNTLFNSLIEKVSHSAEKDFNIQPNQKTQLTYFPTVEELEISDDDLSEQEAGTAEIPSYFSVMGSVLPSGKILMEGVGKAHANALPGRFAALEQTTLELCKEIATGEQRKNEEVVFAEIIFQPGGRTGNIARRPPFFDYEILYLAQAGVEPEKQLALSDLLLSVKNNELVLRSSRLNKRVVPRLSNAHNFATSSLPIYQFLSFLQYPNEIKLAINWGNPTFKRRYLPRVIYGNLILYRSRWFLHTGDISGIISAAEPIAALRNFLSKWKVARFVSLAEGDNELFIDTINTDYLDLLLKEMQKCHTIKLVEWPFALPSPNRVSAGYEIQQFILPLTGNHAKKYLPFSIPANLKKTRKTFEPGSQWMYFKIYCSAGFSDKILMEVVKPSIDHLLKVKVIRNAFFIRYTDPHYHIRFRLQLYENYEQDAYAKALDYFYKRIRPFSEGGILWNIQLDTYQRETERYGEESIEATEEAFFYDSRLFLRCLWHEVFQGNEETRFLAAIKNLDKWLSLFRLPLEEKVSFCEAMGKQFAKEFGRQTKLYIDSKYRELSHVLNTFFESLIFDSEFAERDGQLLKLSLPQKNLSSYIHMSMNRWFVTEQRLMEYMCYVFAKNFYKQLLYYRSKDNQPGAFQ